MKAQAYKNFIGIDIGKFIFVVASHGRKKTGKYTNDSSGFKSFMHDYKKKLNANSLCILETTGGYENALIKELAEKNIAVHRANTLHVKNFIRSLGSGVKTDSLDAKALALFGYERSDRLGRYVSPSPTMKELGELVQRRTELVATRVREKNRKQAPSVEFLGSSYDDLIDFLTKQIEAISERIDCLIEQDHELKEKKQELMTIPGIGSITANCLLIALPELGRIGRKQIASLSGVAPKANDSGQHTGYRTTTHGRSIVKAALFTAAMAARNSNSDLKDYYEDLMARGKKKMVVIVALMRKIIVRANAKLRDLAAGKEVFCAA